MDEHLANFGIPGPGPVPVVDPADLRSVWELMQRMKARLPKTEPLENSAQPGRATSYDFRSLGLSDANGGCSPGANVGAIWYRMMMLEMLEHMSTIGPLLSEIITDRTIPTIPAIDYRNPSDAVFKALAVVPIKGLQPGGPPIEGLPIDVDELGRLIRREDVEPAP